MNDGAIVQIIALIAWLVLAIVAYASLKLEWKTTVRYLFVWGAIFAATTLIISLVMG